MAINMFDGNDELRAEFEIDTEGKFTASQYGLSKILDVHQAFLNTSEVGVKLAERLAAVGFDVHRKTRGQRLNEVQISVIIEYYAFDARNISERARALYRTFATIGIRAFFQQQLGYQQPAETSKQPKYTHAFAELVEAAWKSTQYERLIADQPGEQIVWDSAVDASKCLPGYINCLQWVQSQGVKLTRKGKIRFGQMCAEQYRKAYQDQPPTFYVKQLAKRCPVYPTSFEPQFKAALEQVRQEAGTIV